jgi:ABC-type multidrug transport system fused ATPase/permease subunit
LFIPDQTIAENIALGVERAKIDNERLMKAVEAARLTDLVASLPEGVDTVTGEAGCRLSGGQRQRIGIARALYKEASVLMFDEATSSLDEKTEREVVDAVAGLSEANRDLTILFISHNSRTLDFCDRVVEL